jgi:hypothetical protein
MSQLSEAQALVDAIREMKANRNNPDRVWDQLFGKGWRQQSGGRRVLTEEEQARDAIAGEMWRTGMDG